MQAYSTVGTPDYIAPEVFAKDGYGKRYVKFPFVFCSLLLISCDTCVLSPVSLCSFDVSFWSDVKEVWSEGDMARRARTVSEPLNRSQKIVLSMYVRYSHVPHFLCCDSLW